MKILFVCLGNAYRSPVAESLLKKSNPKIEADSAGIHPAIPISEAAKRYLAKENALEFLKPSPEGLDDKNLESYDMIIAMEHWHKEAVLKKCKKCKSEVTVWNIDDPYFLPHGNTEKIFTQIKLKVEDLANSLLQDLEK
jgi:protein-tyrosine-phosphatase